MRIIIVGCGRMGAGLALQLASDGHAVTIIDQNPAAFELLGPSFKGRSLEGWGFDREILHQAGIERSDALASVTPSDETNAVIARLASQVFRVPRVVVRENDPRKTPIYRRLGLQTVDTTTWGIHRFSELLSYSPLDTVYTIGDGGVDIVEVQVPALLVGRQVRELTVAGEIVVIAITRCGKTFLPTLGTFFQEGDLIHLSIVATAGDRLKRMLGLALAEGG